MAFRDAGVYVITNNANGMMYVGQSSRLGRRRIEHFSKKRGRKLAGAKGMYLDMEKFGLDKFSFEITFFSDSLSERLKIESKTIENLNTVNNGYNSGGSTRDISQLASNKANRTVVQVSLSGEILGTFKSVTEASMATGTGRTGIGKCCNGRALVSNKYRWYYLEPSNTERERYLEIYDRQKRVKFVERDTNSIIYFKNTQEASDYLKINVTKITVLCRGEKEFPKIGTLSYVGLGKDKYIEGYLRTGGKT